MNLQTSRAIKTKQTWDTPELFDLDHFGSTLTVLKGQTNAYEIHCTAPSNSVSEVIYEPVTSGLPVSANCGVP